MYIARFAHFPGGFRRVDLDEVCRQPRAPSQSQEYPDVTSDRRFPAGIPGLSGATCAATG